MRGKASMCKCSSLLSLLLLPSTFTPSKSEPGNKSWVKLVIIFFIKEGQEAERRIEKPAADT